MTLMSAASQTSRNLRRSDRYGDVLAVDNVFCQISGNKVVELSGHNGTGKSSIWGVNETTRHLIRAEIP